MRSILTTGRLRVLSAVVLCIAIAGCEPAAPTSDSDGPAASAAGSAAPIPPTEISETPASAETLTGLDGATLLGVAATAGGLAAVGSDADGAAAWTSQDGVAWQPMRVVRARRADALRAVAFADDGVAFGGDDGGASDVWTSGGGDRWQPAGARRSGIGRSGRVNAVAVDGPRWFAVGDIVDGESGEASAGAVWQSGDGRSWKRVAKMAISEGTVSDVAVAGGRVVVVGFDVRGARMWTVGDGGAATPAEGERFAGATVDGVAAAAAGDGFVALGRDVADLRPVAWTSVDGLKWTRHQVDTEVFAPDEQVHDLTSAAGRVVAVGGAPGGGAVWSSADGVSWTRGL